MSIIALVCQIIIYLRQDIWVKVLSVVRIEDKVFNAFDMICTSLITLIFIITCTIVVNSSREIGKNMSLIEIIVVLILSVICQFGSVIQIRLFSMHGTEYVAVSSCLQSLRSYFVTPFLSLALIFLCIAFGTLLSADHKQ